jgi:galactokinase
MRPGISALRDVSENDLSLAAGRLPEPLARRLRHVVTENARVIRAGEALQSGDMKRLGELMYQSHVSLRDDYQVSCRELDAMVELARVIPGIIGARMTGGGFGGCTINLVQRDGVAEFVARISEGYKQETAITPEIYVTEASDRSARVA